MINDIKLKDLLLLITVNTIRSIEYTYAIRTYIMYELHITLTSLTFYVYCNKAKATLRKISISNGEVNGTTGIGGSETILAPSQYSISGPPPFIFFVPSPCFSGPG